mmetsp:Transcript_15397/g.29006  ORF Transcript_15397/g.29006 Transcript_15397/m.29006 type:complete len:864 (+) Transcript_15397:110-2701(+)
MTMSLDTFLTMILPMFILMVHMVLIQPCVAFGILLQTNRMMLMDPWTWTIVGSSSRTHISTGYVSSRRHLWNVGTGARGVLFVTKTLKTTNNMIMVMMQECCQNESSSNSSADPVSTFDLSGICNNDNASNKEMQWLVRTTCKILQESNTQQGKMSCTTIRRFPLLMRSWMKRCSIPNSNAAIVVEKLLEKLIDELESGNECVTTEGVLCTELYNIVLESWANTSGKEFQKNDGMGTIQYHNDIRDDHGYHLDEQRYIRNKHNKACMKNNHRFAAERAHQILKQMQMQASTRDITPNEKSYLMVIKAWVKSRDPSAVEEIGGILKEIQVIPSSSSESHTNARTIRPTIEWYNYYLYAKANRPSSNPIKDAECALAMLNDLKVKSLKDARLLPDSNTYKQVISIHAKTKSVSGAMTAQSIFDELINNAKFTVLKPTTDIYNALMNCWLKSGSKRGRQRIENLLSNMVEYDHGSPDIVSVNTAISAIAKSQRKDSLRKANFILMNMQTLYGVKPDTTSYNLVIDAYAKSRHLQGGQKADNLLKEMEFQFRNGNRDVMPNSFSYSTVIDAISSDNRCGQLAEELLDRMSCLHQSHGGAIPDTVVYNSIMNVYATQGDKDSMHRIQSILHFMEESFTQGNWNVKPNIITYNTVFKAFAYARDDFTQDAKNLLDRLNMTNDFVNPNGVAPDAISYTTVITCYARSDVPWKAKIAQQLLHQMIDGYKTRNSMTKPTVFTFNAVLNACAYTFNPHEKVDAFMVIVSTLVLLQEFSKPDHTTYGTLLKAWCNLIPKDDERRSRIVRSVFRQCCKDGQVGNMVMQQLKYAASPELYRSLVGKDITQEIKISNLPTKWSRNVKERHGKLPRIS